MTGRDLAPPPPGWVARVPAYAGATVAVLSTLMLVGWARQFEIAARIGPGLPTMKANSALGMLLAALSLLPGRRSRWLATGPLLIAGATLVEWTTRQSLGIDQLLFPDPFADAHPGRPAPQTAVALLVFGAARILTGSPSARRSAAGGALTALYACLAGVLELGQLFGAPELTSTDGGAGISSPGALSAVLLAAGLAALHAHRRPLVRLWDGGLTGQVVRRFLPPAIVVPPVLGLLTTVGERLGWYGDHLAMALYVGSMMLLLAVGVTVTAESVHRLEGERMRILRELEAIFDSVPGTLTMRDPDGRLVRYNRLAPPFAGGTDPAYTPPMLDLLPELADQETQALALGRPVVREHGPTSAGREYEITKFPVYDVDGSVLGIGGYGIDVTERRRTERALREAEQRARHLADHDPLTAIWNRRRFEVELASVLTEMRAGRATDGGLMIVDVDHFKAVNDTGGHVAGDRLLTAVAEALADIVRDIGAASRLGGDEFAVMTCSGDRAEVDRLGRTVVDAVAAAGRTAGIEPHQRVSGSVGVVTFADLAPDHLTTRAALMRADDALYAAKNRGRGRHVVFSDNLTRSG